MSSYINKGTRVFDEDEKSTVQRVRSEARMKRYQSAEDLRTWCDDVEQRRQHILEYEAKNRGSGGACPDKLIPLEALFNAVVSIKDDQIKDLEQDVNRLESLINKMEEINLTPEQKEKFEKLKAELDEEFADLNSDEDNED